MIWERFWPESAGISKAVNVMSPNTGFWARPGTSTTIPLRGQAIRNAAGEAYKWIGLVSDITESKQAEEAISQLAAIVQCSEDAIIGTSLSGAITTWNGGAERLLGYTAAEALGASLSTLLPRPDQAWDILDPSSRGAVSRLDEAVFVCKEWFASSGFADRLAHPQGFRRNYRSGHHRPRHQRAQEGRN